MKSTSVRLLSLLVVIIALAVSCSHPPRQDYPRPITNAYQVVWADPAIILSDSLMSIIQSQRIDSFKVDDPSEISTVQEEGLSFRVFPEPSVVTVFLKDPFGHPILDLFKGRLEPGYYKVNIQVDRINDTARLFPSYVLTAVVGDREIHRPLTR